MTSKLTARQRLFVEEYLIDVNATQAAIRAGYSAKTARAIAEKLMRSPHVAKAIKAAMEARSRKTGITAERVLDEMARIAFLDVAKAFNRDGSLKPLREMDEDARRAIAGFEVTTLTEEGVAIGTVSKVKLADKLRALELIGRHLGMFNDKLTVAGDANNPLVLLLKQVQGAALKPAKLEVVGGREAA